MKTAQKFGLALVIGLFLTTLSACQKQEGPGEHAGKEVDKAIDKVGQEIKQTGQNIQDASKGEKK